MAKRKTRRSTGEGTYWYDETAKRHRWRLSRGGKTYVVSDKDSDRAALRFRELKRNLEDGIRVGQGKQTFGTFFDRWINTVVANEVGESTAHDYAKRAGIYILPPLMHYQLSELTAELGQNWVNTMAKKWAHSSVKQALRLAQRALDRAVGERLIAYNPFGSLRAPRPKTNHTEESEQGRALSAEQVDKFLKAVQNHDLYALYVLAVRLGPRRGELLGLRWQDIDFDKRELRIRQQVIRLDNKVVVSETLKTPSSRRTLPLTDDIVSILRQHKLTLGLAGRDLVFPNEDGGPRQPNAVTQHFRRTVRRLELGDFHFHDLRATAITRWREAGVDLEVAAALAGHEKADVTANTYSDSTMDRKRAAIEKTG